MSKIKIAYSYKGDISIIQQQIDQSIRKALQQLEQSEINNPNSNFKQLKPMIERRLQQFFMNASSRFRNCVEYSKSQQKDVQKIVMEPDQNLQKINQVKTSMLKQTIMKAQRQKYPEINNKVSLRELQTLNIVHFADFKENIDQSLKRNFLKVQDCSKDLQRIKELQELIVESVTKLQIQQKYDSDYYKVKQ